MIDNLVETNKVKDKEGQLHIEMTGFGEDHPQEVEEIRIRK